jgi:hypothetical protein
VPMAGVVPMGNRRWGAGAIARGLIDARRGQPAGERYARGRCLLRPAGVSQHHIARDTPDAVPRKAIDTIIDAATKALNGGHHPPWAFMAMIDRELIIPMGQLSRDAWLGALGATPPPETSPI